MLASSSTGLPIDNFKKPILLQQTIQESRRLRLPIAMMNRSQFALFFLYQVRFKTCSNLINTNPHNLSRWSLTFGRLSRHIIWQSETTHNHLVVKCNSSIVVKIVPGLEDHTEYTTMQNHETRPRYSSTKAVWCDSFEGHILHIHVIRP